jgi:hypothetical protein
MRFLGSCLPTQRGTDGYPKRYAGPGRSGQTYAQELGIKWPRLDGKHPLESPTQAAAIICSLAPGAEK